MKKLPVSELLNQPDKSDPVQFLKENKGTAYDTEQIMVDRYGVSPDALKGKWFKDRKRSDNQLRQKIKDRLESAAADGTIQKRRHGRADMFYSE